MFLSVCFLSINPPLTNQRSKHKKHIFHGVAHLFHDEASQHDVYVCLIWQIISIHVQCLCVVFFSVFSQTKAKEINFSAVPRFVFLLSLAVLHSSIQLLFTLPFKQTTILCHHWQFNIKIGEQELQQQRQQSPVDRSLFSGFPILRVQQIIYAHILFIL